MFFRVIFFVVMFCRLSYSLYCGSGWDFPGDKTCRFEEAYPRQYIAYRTKVAPVMDGDVLNDPVWKEVGWSEEYMDISGTSFPKPWFVTNMKIRYDDDWLYFAGYVEESEIWAYLTKRNSIIFHDNDFEIFVDPAKTTHYYKEFEMNANNAVWDLCLNMPYTNGGYENSSRVFGDHGFDMKTLKSAVFINGTINDPAAKNYYWTVEVALPLSGLVYNQTEYVSIPPKHNDFWKIDFSRVEYNVSVVNGQYKPIPGIPVNNWVWSPQGVIAMHLPERWGYVQFSEAPVNTTEMKKDPEWPVRYIIAQLYYANCAYNDKKKEYTDNINTLISLSPKDTINGLCSTLPKVKLSADKKSYQASVTSLDGCYTATINEQRFTTVKKHC